MFFFLLLSHDFLAELIILASFLIVFVYVDNLIASFFFNLHLSLNQTKQRFVNPIFLFYSSIELKYFICELLFIYIFLLRTLLVS